jgi:hypothetical protein
MVDAIETIAPVPLSPAVDSVPDPEIEDEEPVIAPVHENLREPLAAIVDGVEVRDPLPVKDTPPICDSSRLMD